MTGSLSVSEPLQCTGGPRGPREHDVSDAGVDHFQKQGARTAAPQDHPHITIVAGRTISLDRVRCGSVLNEDCFPLPGFRGRSPVVPYLGVFRRHAGRGRTPAVKIGDGLLSGFGSHTAPFSWMSVPRIERSSLVPSGGRCRIRRYSPRVPERPHPARPGAAVGPNSRNARDSRRPPPPPGPLPPTPMRIEERPSAMNVDRRRILGQQGGDEAVAVTMTRVATSSFVRQGRRESSQASRAAPVMSPRSAPCTRSQACSRTGMVSPHANLEDPLVGGTILAGLMPSSVVPV